MPASCRPKGQKRSPNKSEFWTKMKQAKRSKSPSFNYKGSRYDKKVVEVVVYKKSRKRSRR